MHRIFVLLLILTPILCFSQKDLELWYTTPAQKWTDAMPVGNGRIGGMVFGRYDNERIQLNEESIWGGSKINNNNKQSAIHLPEIQKALFESDYKKALELSSAYMVGTPPRVRSYQPLGNLIINYGWKTTPEQYRRSLTLNTGIATTTYTIDGKKVKQQVFVSAPQDVMVVHISSETPVDLHIAISRERDIDVYKSEKDIAYYSGQVDDKEDSLTGPGGKHMRFATAIKIISTDGNSIPVQTDTSAGYNLIKAKKLVLLITGASNYNIKKLDTDDSIDPLLISKEKIKNASVFTAMALQQQHEKDHRSFFDRVSFNLGSDINAGLPINERLAKVKSGEQDNGLIALYYQFGRYLLMASSRKPGVLPANLQGIWNDMYNAPWNSDFHTNINLQMNYWPAESGNLPETVLPLADFMQQIIVPGGATAKEMYNARGWTLHHLTDVYGRTGVADGVWGVSPMAGPWMTFPLYRHYEFTGDVEYLRKVAYPVIKGSVEFILDFLVKSPEGYLVTNPSHSPENAFFVPGSDKKENSQLSYASTIDVEIIHGLFNNFINATNVLNTDKDLADKVKAAQKQLPPLQVAANGTIQEWIKDFEEVEPGHRHISHLLGLYPLNLISPNTPALFTAAQKTIERRLANGGGHTGWSKAWIINFYARLLNGEEAGKQVQSLLQKSTLPSLLSTHPPFQIDGNFGGAAGIAEMLLQSQNNEIRVLPALPSTWATGAIKGIKARGGYTVDIEWKNGILAYLIIKAEKNAVYKVRYKDIVKEVKLKKGNNSIKF